MKNKTEKICKYKDETKKYYNHNSPYWLRAISEFDDLETRLQMAEQFIGVVIGFATSGHHSQSIAMLNRLSESYKKIA